MRVADVTSSGRWTALLAEGGNSRSGTVLAGDEANPRPAIELGVRAVGQSVQLVLKQEGWSSVAIDSIVDGRKCCSSD